MVWPVATRTCMSAADERHDSCLCIPTQRLRSSLGLSEITGTWDAPPWLWWATWLPVLGALSAIPLFGDAPKTHSVQKGYQSQSSCSQSRTASKMADSNTTHASPRKPLQSTNMQLPCIQPHHPVDLTAIFTFNLGQHTPFGRTNKDTSAQHVLHNRSSL